MKYILSSMILALLYLTVTGQPVNVYQLSFAGIDKDQINMSDYKCKKIIVFEYDAAKPDIKQLVFLDSLYQSRKANLVVIAIPVEDFEVAPLEKDLLKLLRDTLKIDFIVTKISKAKKTNGTAQHKLLSWLTHKNQNNHFEEEIEKDGQAFIISETGGLFACIKEKKDILKIDIVNLLLEQKIPNN